MTYHLVIERRAQKALARLEQRERSQSHEPWRHWQGRRGIEFVQRDCANAVMSEMESVNISELRNHLPRYLARVEAGEQLLVTRRGRVVAQISAVEYGQTVARRQLESLRERARVGDVVSSIEEWFTVER